MRDTYLGFPSLEPSSVSATMTLHVVDVLHREVHIAALMGDAEGMKDIEVVCLEVGALDIPLFAGRRSLDYDPKEYTSHGCLWRSWPMDWHGSLC